MRFWSFFYGFSLIFATTAILHTTFSLQKGKKWVVSMPFAAPRSICIPHNLQLLLLYYTPILYIYDAYEESLLCISPLYTILLHICECDDIAQFTTTVLPLYLTNTTGDECILRWIFSDVIFQQQEEFSMAGYTNFEDRGEVGA